MSNSPSRLPARPSLEQLRKQAKDLLRAAHAGDAAAGARFQAVDPRRPVGRDPKLTILADAQLVVSRASTGSRPGDSSFTTFANSPLLPSPRS